MTQVLKVVLVTAVAESFRRAGFGFTNKGTALLREQFTDEQYKQIVNEPRLSLREVTEDQIPAGAHIAYSAALAAKEQAQGDGQQGEDLQTVGTLAEAFALLDPSNPDHFTSGNKPQLDPLSKLLGRPVTAAERDTAFAEFKAQAAQ